MNIGTIGHVDHGKTTLTAAITKVLSYRGCPVYSLRSDRQGTRREGRELPFPQRTLSMKQTTGIMPMSTVGHADYVKNMITGAAQMDGAILVVSALMAPCPRQESTFFLQGRSACHT